MTVAFGQQVANARATGLSDEAMADAVRRAEQLAKDAAPDPEYVPPVSEQRYPVLPTFRADTAAIGPSRRAGMLQEPIELCHAAGFQADGTLRTCLSAVGVAANTGLFAFGRRTLAEMEFTVTAWPVVITAENVHRSINDLGVLKHVRRALERVKRLAEPRKVPAGRHTAILEPRAVAQLLRPLLDAADVRAYHNGDSALCGKLGEAIVDTRLTLRNRPDHPDLLGKGFDAIGLASNARTWIERGVLTQIHYDRLTARDYGTPPTYVPDAPHLSGIGPASESVDELIRATKHGILVTDLGDPVCAESTDLTLTGATAGGLFLIEDGQIVAGVEAMRWSDSPLRAFNEVESYTVPLEAPVRPADGGGPVTAGLRKMLVPAMVVRDFNFSSAARS